MTDFQPQGAPAPNQRTGYESFDLSFRGILLSALILGVIATAAQIGLGFLMDEFARIHSRELARRPAIFRENRGQFPEPTLQSSPAADMARFRRQEVDRLNSYGWTDKQKRIAHIPIERAMQQILSQGLPTRKIEKNGTRTKEKP